jgi:hypothetical protein
VLTGPIPWSMLALVGLPEVVQVSVDEPGEVKLVGDAERLQTTGMTVLTVTVVWHTPTEAPLLTVSRYVVVAPGLTDLLPPDVLTGPIPWSMLALVGLPEVVQVSVDEPGEVKLVGDGDSVQETRLFTVIVLEQERVPPGPLTVKV